MYRQSRVGILEKSLIKNRHVRGIKDAAFFRHPAVEFGIVLRGQILLGEIGRPAAAAIIGDGQKYRHRQPAGQGQALERIRRESRLQQQLQIAGNQHHQRRPAPSLP